MAVITPEMVGRVSDVGDRSAMLPPSKTQALWLGRLRGAYRVACAVLALSLAMQLFTLVRSILR